MLIDKKDMKTILMAKVKRKGFDDPKIIIDGTANR